jgi:hypothetical protein
MSEHCPRCSSSLVRDGEDPLCLKCGTLSIGGLTPAEAEAELLQEESIYIGRIRRRGPSILGRPPHESEDAAAIATLIREFGDMPVEAWDEAANRNRRSAKEMAGAQWGEQFRMALETNRARVLAGETFSSPMVVLGEPETTPPRDPVRWLAWRVDHGLPISVEILERELGLSWSEAEQAMSSPWHHYLGGGE